MTFLKYSFAVIIILLITLNIPCLSQQWTDTGLTFITHVEACSKDTNTAYCASIYTDGISKSIDGGNTWSRLIDNARSDKIIINPKYNNIVYATIANCGPPNYFDNSLIRSKDGGSTWNYVIKNRYDEHYMDVLFYPGNPDTLFLLSGGVFGGYLLRSFNAGTSWDTLDVPKGGSIKLFRFDQINNNMIYTAFYNSNRLYKSSDLGATWDTTSSWNDQHSPKYLAIHPAIANRVFVLVGNYFLESSDGGATWAYLDSSSTDGYYSVFFDPEQPERIILNKSGDAFLSEDRGQSWHSIGYNLEDQSIGIVYYNPVLRKLFCSTRETAFKTFILNYDDIVLSTEPGSNQPTDFQLCQNYPNPFNGTTNLPFFIKESSDINISIYNIAGFKVKTLVDGTYAPGRYFITWDGKNDWGKLVSSGEYLIKMKMNKKNKVIARKCLLIR